MAYLSKDAPIGPNSLQAARCVNDAAVNETNAQAALGRLGTFLTTPPSSSFANLTLAVNAKRILDQSREGRGSILSASSPLPNQHPERVNLQELIADAPEVVALNPRGESCGGVVVRRVERPAPPQMVMPELAPVSVRVSPASPPVFIQAPFAPQYIDQPVYQGPAITASPAVPLEWDAVSLGPGGPGGSGWKEPTEGPAMQVGPTQYYGYSGYAPPWGDAGLLDVGVMADDGSSGGGWFKGLMILGGLVILGGAVTGGVKRARGKRRFR